MHLRKSWGIASLLALCLFLALPAWAADSVVMQAKKYMDENNPQAAYDLLEPLQSERAGDPEYDYLLGVACLGLGKNTEAVFALERVLAVQPNSVPARAQIARAYFALKEINAAKREFESVKNQDLPPEVRATIDRYLDAIDRTADAEKFKARFFIEFVLGWDSNINNATQDSQVAVPAFNNIYLSLAPTAIEEHSGFLSMAAGINISSPLAKGLSLIGGLSALQRNNFSQDNFDIGYLDGYIGLAQKYERDTFTLVGQGNAFFVDQPQYSTTFRNAVGGTVQWTHDFNARNQVTAYFQYADLSYPTQSPQDANRYIAGAAYAHAFRGGDPIVYAGVYGGLEDDKQEAFKYFGYRPIGLRLGGQKALSETWLAFAYAGAERREYMGQDPFFLVEREDKQYSGGIGVSWQFARNWRLSPQVSYLKNNSNIVLNAYDRTQIFVLVRADF